MDATSKTTKWTKGRALLAGGLVLGFGAAATLAAWTDDEWVFGGSGSGNGNEPGTPGTGIYRMQQNTWTGTTEPASWSDQPNANGGALTFTMRPDRLVPGKTVYAPMQLRTVAGSEALTVSLAEGIQAAVNPAISARYNSTELYNALTYDVFVGVDKDSCERGVVSAGTSLFDAALKPNIPLTTKGDKTFDLAAGTADTPGEATNLCFALTLPLSTDDETLQGLNTVPAWRFTSSVEQ